VERRTSSEDFQEVLECDGRFPDVQFWDELHEVDESPDYVFAPHPLERDVPLHSAA
jgi:hypothetical protein